MVKQRDIARAAAHDAGDQRRPFRFSTTVKFTVRTELPVPPASAPLKAVAVSV